MKIIEEIKRKNTLLEFGFGVDAMKRKTVCTECHSLQPSGRMFCSECGTRLPTVNLYDYYRAQHESCPDCGCILANSMSYCPKCGVKVKELAIP